CAQRLIMTPSPPVTSVNPYTTLFRSAGAAVGRAGAEERRPELALHLRRHPLPVVDHPDQHAGLVVLDLQRDARGGAPLEGIARVDRKSTRLNSSHVKISYAVFCWK